MNNTPLDFKKLTAQLFFMQWFHLILGIMMVDIAVLFIVIWYLRNFVY